MPSLKDMRVRIAATKATQKITKAMQMVAASKLRRAQAVAEAARPYAQQMTKVLGNIAAAAGDLGAAPRLLVGTGSERVHLLLVCTAERGLCGPFNSAIVRLAREPQGLRAASPAVRETDHRTHRVTRSSHACLRARRKDRRKNCAALRAGCIRCLYPVLFAIQVRHCANSYGSTDHSARVRGRWRQR